MAEELENEELDEEEETETEQDTKVIELDYSMDATERLKIEIANTEDQNEKQIGAYLLEQFEKDTPLKNAYAERKITLKAVGKFVMECAKKQLDNKNGMIADNVVFGWVLHFVQDEPVKIDEKETYKLSELDKDKAKKQAMAQFEAEELAKIKKAEQRKKEAQQKAIEKEKKHNEEIGQMSLFDL